MLVLTICSTVGSVRKQPSIYKRVKLYSTELVKYMEPRFGLVDELISLSVLSRPDSHIVQSKHSAQEQNIQIIKFVLKRPSKDAHIFLQALSGNDQQHVVNYILYAAGTMQLLPRCNVVYR